MLIPGYSALGTYADDNEGSHNEDPRQDGRHNCDDRRHFPPATHKLPYVIGQTPQVHIQQRPCTKQLPSLRTCRVHRVEREVLIC